MGRRKSISKKGSQPESSQFEEKQMQKASPEKKKELNKQLEELQQQQQQQLQGRCQAGQEGGEGFSSSGFEEADLEPFKWRRRIHPAVYLTWESHGRGSDVFFSIFC